MRGKKFIIDPPPKEKGLYRVVYVIDIGAESSLDAAKKTHEIMTAVRSRRSILARVTKSLKMLTRVSDC